MSLLTQFYDCGGGGTWDFSEGTSFEGAQVFTVVGDPNSSAGPSASGWQTPPTVTAIPGGTFVNHYVNYYSGAAPTSAGSVEFTGGAVLNVVRAKQVISRAGINFTVTTTVTANGVETWTGGYVRGSMPGGTFSSTTLHTLKNCGFGNNWTFNLPSLTTLENVNPAGGFSFIMQGAALTADSVNNFLIRCANGGLSGATIDFQLGTSAGTAQLTPAGAAAVLTLQGNGCTILLN